MYQATIPEFVPAAPRPRVPCEPATFEELASGERHRRDAGLKLDVVESLTTAVWREDEVVRFCHAYLKYAVGSGTLQPAWWDCVCCFFWFYLSP